MRSIEARSRQVERAEPDLPPLKILVGEDSEVNQKLIAEMLTRRGHAVHVAGDGEEALAALERDRFDLVLLDVQMPRMDGFEATRRIRRREAESGGHVPVVAMTAHALPEDRGRCLSAGMDEYIAKPIRTSVLLATMAKALDGARPAAAGEPIAPAALAAALLPPQRQTRPTAGRFDRQRAVEGFEGNSQLLRVAAQAALEESPRLAAAIRAAIGARPHAIAAGGPYAQGIAALFWRDHRS